MFSDKRFVDIPYHLEDVKAAATGSTTLSEGSEQCAERGLASL